MRREHGQLVEAIVREAMARRVPISAIYKDRPRVVCPHILGWKGDTVHVLCY